MLDEHFIFMVSGKMNEYYFAGSPILRLDEL